MNDDDDCPDDFDLNLADADDHQSRRDDRPVCCGCDQSFEPESSDAVAFATFCSSTCEGGD